jgi:membrane protease YdiL (CAAX protease family)
MPLLVLAAISDHARTSGIAALPGPYALPALAGATGDPVQDLPLMARLTIAIGAGLYEEMLFRLVGLALLHWIIVDLIEAPQKAGMAIAVVLSALAFALYHKPELPQEYGKLLFYTISGIYLGSVYLMRGFGITVGTHAIYDILVLVVFPSLRHG